MVNRISRSQAFNCSQLILALAFPAVLTGCQGNTAASTDSTICIPIGAQITSGAYDSKTINLQGMSPDNIKAQLRRAKSSDLVIVGADFEHNKQIMEHMANANNVKFCMVTDGSDNATRSVLNTAIGSPQIVAVLPNIPTNAPSMSPALLRRMERYKQQNVGRYQELQNTTLLSDTDAIPFPDAVTNLIRKGKSEEPFIVVGHNVGGGIESPDGKSQITFADINSECRKVNRVAIVLSCSTMKDGAQFPDGFVTLHDLEIDEVAYALKKTQQAWNNENNHGANATNGLDTQNQEHTVRNLITQLSTLLDEPRKQRQTKRVAVVTAAGTLVLVVTIYYVENCGDSDKPCEGSGKSETVNGKGN